MQKITRLSLAPGVFMTCIATARFKTAVFSAALALPLREENAPFAVLPPLLYRGTAAHPDLAALGETLDTLYGARIEPYVRKVGESLVLGFLSDVIDGACVPDGDALAERTAALLGELICRPALENGRFRPDDLAAERANLCDRIAALPNDPRGWAVRRAKELMCAGEPFGACEFGTGAGARALAADAVWVAYQTALRAARRARFYCGSMEPGAVRDAFSRALELADTGLRYQPDPDVCRIRRADRTIVEEMPVKQGKLTLGFRTNCIAGDEDYPALLLFNAAFGGYTGSRLFRTVREKLSLCYYASSALDKVKGLMLVSSGIENESFERARGEILRQFEDLRAGGLKQDELDRARRTVQNNLRAMQDSPLQLERFWQGQVLAGADASPDELIARLDAVDRGQVMAVGRRIDLDLTYFLKGVAE